MDKARAPVCGGLPFQGTGRSRVATAGILSQCPSCVTLGKAENLPQVDFRCLLGRMKRTGTWSLKSIHASIPSNIY
jgi:hypothetical protein